MKISLRNFLLLLCLLFQMQWLCQPAADGSHRGQI